MALNANLSVSLIGAVPPPFGGISIYVKQLAETLADHGVKVEIIDITGIKKEFRQKNVRLILVKSWHTKEFVKALLKSPAQVFHVHVSTYKVDPLLLLMECIARLRGRKFVMTIHGAGFINLMEKPIPRKILRLIALNVADGIIAMDEKLYKKAFSVVSSRKRGKTRFLPPPIHAVKFNPKIDGATVRNKYNINAKSNLVLFGPHLEPIYAPEEFIKAAIKVSKKHPNTVFMLLGEGPIKEKLKQLVKEAKLEKNVIFCGAVSYSDVPNYYAACDIYCNPSVFGQGISTFEAMACGKPVIGAQAKSQIRIRDKIDGLLFRVGDEEDLANKINWLLEHPEERKKMGAYGRQRIQVENSHIEHAKKLVKFYNEI